jgi:hypothetical protein
MDHSHMDHGHMGHMPGMDHDMPAQCNMNVRTHHPFIFSLHEPKLIANTDAIYVGHDEPVHCFPRVAHHGHRLADCVAPCDCADDGGI